MKFEKNGVMFECSVEEYKELFAVKKYKGRPKGSKNKPKVGRSKRTGKKVSKNIKEVHKIAHNIKRRNPKMTYGQAQKKAWDKWRNKNKK